MQSRATDASSTDLVFDARCWDQVVPALRERQVLPATLHAEAAPELDLVLVRGLVLEAYAARAERRWRAEVAASSGAAEPSALDYLLHDLRRELGERSGQVPVLAKNRDAVVGYPQHKALKFPSQPLGDFVVPRSRAGDGVTVGIVDTAPAQHPALPPELVDTDGWYTPGAGEVTPWAGHGTFVAGLVRHEAPAARLRMRAGLSPDRGAATCWDVARAIAGFRGSGVAVLNLSFGCVTADGAPPLLLERALARLGGDVLVVCAAGNRGLDRDPPAYLWPGAATTAVAVGAGAASGEAADRFSLQRDWVDVVAAGREVTSAFLDLPVTLADPSDPDTAPTTEEFHGVASWSGTSFSAATVSGKIAARMSAGRHVSAREALTQLVRERDSGVAAYEPER